ncbi:MAG: hypothetical protein ABI183_25400 [Polyangiaceae bacterium]
MNLRILFLTSAMVLTACGATPTGRSTLPIADVAPIAAGPTPVAQNSGAHVADPTLPDKQVDISAEGAFASSK